MRVSDVGDTPTRGEMLTLGIHDGHTATATVLEDGRVTACISEERLNREKEWYGFPVRALQACLALTRKDPRDFDAVGVCSLLPQIGHDGYRNPSPAKRVFGLAASVLPRAWLQREGNVRLAQWAGQRLTAARRARYRERLAALGFLCPHRFYEHHLLHATSAYYTNWYRPDPCLVITLDGSGDGVCGTVQIGQGGQLRRLASVFNYNSICELYTRVTQHLGMQPMSHEYKVMGLAPYADEARRHELGARLRPLFRIPEDLPLQLRNESGHWKWQFEALFGRLFRGARFDVISGAVQDFFEEFVTAWVQNAIRVTGIPDLALSGGGFMNVKLNGKLLALPEVRTLFIFPSCGDESNPVGAAIRAALDAGCEPSAIEPLGMLDWGPGYTDDDARAAIEARLPTRGFRVSRHEDIDRHVGVELAKGKIVGRLSGRMEWGARALGHRSILADPRSPLVIQRLNKAIKMRDFWMPFAPAVLAERAGRYLKLPAGFRCPFMAVPSRRPPDTSPSPRHKLPAPGRALPARSGWSVRPPGD